MADNINILVAEDFEFNQLVIKQLLKELSFRFLIVNNGKEVLEQLAEQKFDIVFMDIEMPVMDGIETIRAMKSSALQESTQIPVVGFTGHKDPSFIAELRKQGFVDFIAKPFRKEEILRIINQYVIKSDIVDENDQPQGLPNEDKNNTLYDLTNLRAFSDNDEEFVVKMLSYFIENSPKVIMRMREYFDESNWDQLKMEAHKFNSELGLLGIGEMLRLSEKIEEGASSMTDLEKLSTHIGLLKVQGEKVVDKLKSDFEITIK